MKSLLVVGLGSIGRRHLAVARQLYPDIKLLAASSRGVSHTLQNSSFEICRSIEKALAQNPAGVIIASPATCHVDHAERTLAAGLPTLIEKPLAQDANRARQFMQKWGACDKVAVAYPFRYSPIVHACRRRIRQLVLGPVVSVQINAGQYLPEWRPRIDYRDSVSAQRALGGGVLLELSHEFDLICWIIGEVVQVAAALGQSSELEIDVEDQADVLLRCSDDTLINLHLDMLQRFPRREWQITCENGNMTLDLIKGEIRCCQSSQKGWQTESFTLGRNAMYTEQLRAFADLVNEGVAWPGASVTAGYKVLKIIDAIRLADRSGKWINIDGD